MLALSMYLGGSDDASAGVDVEGTVIVIVVGGDEGVGDGGVVALISVCRPHLQPHSLLIDWDYRNGLRRKVQ